jgi:hypothetical protein
MTQDPNAPATTDALLARYHAAQAALDAHEASGPSAQTRARILDHAANIATNSVAAPAIKQSASGQIDTQKSAANDGQWKIRALATVAIFGLTSLLLLQWDRGTPEEKEVAFSTARPPVAAPAPAAAPAAATVTEPASAAARAAAPPVPPATATADAPAAVRPVDKSDAAAKAAPPSARLAAPKVTQQAAPASARAQPFPSDAEAKRPSGVAPPPSTKDATTSAESAMAGATALPAPASAPAPLSAPAPSPAAPSMAAAAPPARAAAPAMRTAPAAKAGSDGIADSARREDAPQATARLKKSESAQDASSVADANSAPAFRAAAPNLALFAAIRSADAPALQRALASGADKNAKSNGTPAITLCVQSGKLNLVQLLAAAGADVNAPDAQGTTPLAHARARGFDAIANVLVGLGAN